jgi:cysteine desulfurase
MESEAERIEKLRDRLKTNLLRLVPDTQVNGDMAHRLAGNINVSFAGVTAPDLIAACPGIAISSGSACTSAVVEPSYVLRALGLPDAMANASIRLGLGRFTTQDEVDFAVDAIAAAVSRLRREHG